MNEGSERTLELLAPEGTLLRFPLARPFERLIAYAFDVVVSQLLVLALFILAMLLAVGLAFAGSTLFWQLIALAMLASFLLRYGYFLFFETRFQGVTPGKWMLSLRVVARDGAPLSLETLVARNVMRDLEVLLPIQVMIAPEAILGTAPWWISYPAGAWLVLVALLPMISREHLRAGDLVAGTVVVRVPRAGILRDQARGQEDVVTFRREHLRIYGELELETLVDLLRQYEVSVASDEDLRLVARVIARRIEWNGSEPEQQPERFLRAFYRQQRAELERHLVLGRRFVDKAQRRDKA